MATYWYFQINDNENYCLKVIDCEKHCLNIGFNDRFLKKYVEYNFIYEKKINKYTLDQSREADIVIPKQLIFELEDEFGNTTIDEIKNALYGSEINIYVGSINILTNLLDLYVHLENPIKINNKIIIKFPFDYLLDKFVTIDLAYSSIRYIIKFNHNMIMRFSNISMNAELTYIDDEQRRCFKKRNKYSYLIQYIQSEIIDLMLIDQLPQMEFVQKVNFKHMTKGYFIQGKIDELTNVELYLDDVLRFSYDYIILHTLCNRISENLIYISLTGSNMNYKEITHESYKGGFNQNLIDKIVFKLKFSRPQIRFSIYSITLNAVQISNGMMGVYFYKNDDQIININTAYTNNKQIKQ